MIIVTNLQYGFDEKIIFSRLRPFEKICKPRKDNHDSQLDVYIHRHWTIENYKILRSRDEINKFRSIVTFLKFSSVFDLL